MTESKAYEAIKGRSREAALLSSCAALLGWDEQTQMPRAAAPWRGDQLALLAGLVHERATDPAVGALLEELGDWAAAGTPEAANIREWKRRYDRATRLPRGLVESIARAENDGQNRWVEARAKDDYAILRPALAELVRLERERAACLREEGQTVYEALLDEYEPGARESGLEALFSGLRGRLLPLIDKAAGAVTADEAAFLHANYPVERQRWFSELVAQSIGFDFRGGRLDLTEHPFCSGITPGDCRLTTRYDPRDLLDGLFSVLHEAGHGLYEQGLDPARFGTPLGESASLGIHESQSRLWENGIGRGRAFWGHWLPILKGTFPGPLREVSLEKFLRVINRVERSLIRIQADELTYNLHIMIRYDLERALVGGHLDVNDLPGAWNDAYERDLGIRPGSDREGCMQDIHWPAGLFGYFPTYTLGNVLAAQLLEAAQRDLPDLNSRIAAGDTADLLRWLRENVHRHGKRYTLEELARRVCGTGLDAGPLAAHLETKVNEILA